ncbi:MAG: hypothetical protein IPN58_21495 [Anaerolineales bacterium]|nr:hypothetical protein [Anaerolineales bacterium]
MDLAKAIRFALYDLPSDKPKDTPGKWYKTKSIGLDGSRNKKDLVLMDEKAVKIKEQNMHTTHF